jgi:hypothetical protein
MAAPGYLPTPRGGVNKYVYHRTDLGYENPDKISDDENTGLQGSESKDGITQGTLNGYNTANFGTTGGKVLTYNPITDTFGISNGEYVL